MFNTTTTTTTTNDDNNNPSGGSRESWRPVRLGDVADHRADGDDGDQGTIMIFMLIIYTTTATTTTTTSTTTTTTTGNNHNYDTVTDNHTLQTEMTVSIDRLVYIV